MTSDISYQNENVPLLKANATKMTGVSSSPIASLKKKLAFGFAVGIGLMYAATSGSGYISSPYLSLLRGGVEVQVTGGCGDNCSTCVGFWKQNNYCSDNSGKLGQASQVCGCLDNDNNYATTAQCEVNYPGLGGQCPLGVRYAFYNGQNDDDDETDACGGTEPRNRPSCQFRDGCTPGCDQCDSNLQCYGGKYGFIDTGLCCSPGVTECNRAAGAQYGWVANAPMCFPPEPVVTAPAPAPSPVGIKAYWKEIPSSAISTSLTTADSNSISSSNQNAIENGFKASVTLGYGPVSSGTLGYSHDGTHTKTYTVTYGGSNSGTIIKTTNACPTGDKEYTWVIQFPDGDTKTTDVVCIPGTVLDFFRYAKPQCPAGFCGCVSCECCTATVLNAAPNFPVAKICADDSLATFPGGLATCDWDSVAQASSIQKTKEQNELD